jgi:hypothetical protein
VELDVTKSQEERWSWWCTTVILTSLGWMARPCLKGKQSKAKQCNAMQCNAMQCNAMQRKAKQKKIGALWLMPIISAT